MLALQNINPDLNVPKKKTNSGQKCFSYRGVKSWNALPIEIKQTPSMQVFKSKTEIRLSIFFYFILFFLLFY